jgi:putative ABC transport system ATP-binding protein
MVTHDPYAAAIADRILFLADGLIVRDMPRAEPSEVIGAMDELTQA